MEVRWSDNRIVHVNKSSLKEVPIWRRDDAVDQIKDNRKSPRQLVAAENGA